MLPTTNTLWFSSPSAAQLVLIKVVVLELVNQQVWPQLPASATQTGRCGQLRSIYTAVHFLALDNSRAPFVGRKISESQKQAGLTHSPRTDWRLIWRLEQFRQNDVDCFG